MPSQTNPSGAEHGGGDSGSRWECFNSDHEVLPNFEERTPHEERTDRLVDLLRTLRQTCVRPALLAQAPSRDQ